MVARKQKPAAEKAKTAGKEVLSNTGNVKVWDEFNENLKTILALKDFQNIQDAAPLGIGEGSKGLLGFQAAYDPKNYKSSMTTAGEHKVGVNFFWQLMCFATSPGVPLIASRIAELEDYYFKETPAKYSLDLPFAVPSADYDPMQHKGHPHTSWGVPHTIPWGTMHHVRPRPYGERKDTDTHVIWCACAPCPGALARCFV